MVMRGVVLGRLGWGRKLCLGVPERGADEFLKGGSGRGFFEGVADGFVGVGGLEPEGDEGGGGVGGEGGLGGVRRGRRGGGGGMGAGRGEFVAELDDEALGGFLADAGAVGEEFHVAACDGVLEGGEAEAAEDVEGGFGADAADFFDEEAEEVAFLCGGESVEGVFVFADDLEGVEAERAAGRGEFFGGGDGDVDFVADAGGFDDGAKEA